MPSYNFTAPFVHWEEVPQHYQIKSILLPSILKYTHEYGQRGIGNALTTFYSTLDSHASILTKELIDAIIWKQFDKMLEERQFYPRVIESHIKSLWFNHYNPGDYAIAHHHNNADFCGIYLLDCPDDNTTVFHPHVSSTHYPMDANPYFTHHIKEGNVLFWPSHLMHSATPCKTDRTIIAFNIVSGYSYAEEHTN